MSEMHEFIKSKLGRSSAKLVGSFQKYLKKRHPLEPADAQHFWEAEYPHWIKTVTQRPPAPQNNNAEEITCTQLYKVISRQQDEIKQLKQQLTAANRCNKRYQAPLQKVLEALAIYGD